MKISPKIIDKIRRCLALSKSPNPNEAALALAKARELMDKYNVSDIDVAVAEIKEANSVVSNTKQLPAYFIQLSSIINDLFHTKSYLNIRFDKKKSCVVTDMVFVGYEPNELLAKYAFDVVARKLKAARKNYLQSIPKQTKRYNKIKRADSFAMGWVIGIEQKLEILVPEHNDLDSRAMVISCALDKFIEDRTTATASSINRHKRGKDALNGFIEGSKETIHKGMVNENLLRL